MDPDDDNDGMPDVDEAVAGTDPMDAGSMLEISEIASEASGCGLLFDSVSGRLYGVYYRGDLLDGQWLPLETNLTGTGPTQFIDPSPGSRRFYRLKVRLP